MTKVAGRPQVSDLGRRENAQVDKCPQRERQTDRPPAPLVGSPGQSLFGENAPTWHSQPGPCTSSSRPPSVNGVPRLRLKALLSALMLLYTPVWSPSNPVVSLPDTSVSDHFSRLLSHSWGPPVPLPALPAPPVFLSIAARVCSDQVTPPLKASLNKSPNLSQICPLLASVTVYYSSPPSRHKGLPTT